MVYVAFGITSPAAEKGRLYIQIGDKMSKVEEFREAVNSNKDWQEEVRNFGDDDNIVNYASGKGYEFSNDEYNDYVEENSSGELSEFEGALISGGGQQDSIC